MKHLFYYISLTIILTATLSGCSREEEHIISLMGVESYQIYVASTEVPTLYAVSVKVVGILADSCNNHHKTHYDEPYISRRILQPNYKNGDTVTIEITQSESTSTSGYCLTAVHYYIPVLFLGYFEKGIYTLIVNGYSNDFTVG